MIGASQDKARELGVAVSTAIVDPEGRLFAFERMEGARWISVEVSQSKAYTGALLGRDGPDLAQVAPAALAGLAAMHNRALMPTGSVTVLREGTRSSPASDAAARPTSRMGSVRTQRATPIPGSVDRTYVGLDTNGLVRVAPAPAFGALVHASARRTRRGRAAIEVIA